MKTQLTELTRALRDLHKQLINLETQYFGAVGSPLEHLQLITNHPHFAWLQKLSGLMTQLDERLDDPEPVTAEEAKAFRQSLEMLIGPCEEGDQEFRARYNALLHDGPELVMAHGAVRKLLAAI
nr:hypothetical protein [uncultured Duganella sp.]